MNFALRLFASIGLCTVACVVQSLAQAQQWPTYGGDPGGQRYTASQQITKSNVTRLVPAWTFHTGSVAKNRPGVKNSSFEATPVLFHDRLYLTSPYDEVYAVSPETGAKIWEYDPKLTSNLTIGLLTSRGVATWDQPSAASGTPCAARVFVATMDDRLIALDATTGAPCAGFGQGGTVDLLHDLYKPADGYFFSSAPTVVGNVVILGSAIADNQRVDAEDGVVRAFDCVTGALVWSWEPIPWAKGQKVRTGAANAWSVLSADPEHNLVYVPTGAPSPDYYGAGRPGDNRDANSVVALEATTGKRVWGFQVVHHDVWDYDVAAEPLLFTFRGTIPAVAITTKMGLIFVLNRLTGEPLYPVTERPVPASDIPGETLSPTQPFQEIDTLGPITIPPDAKLGNSAKDDAACRRMMGELRYEGIYTPPSLKGSLNFPGNLGGVNWGSAAIDPVTGVLYANTNRLAFSTKLVPRGGKLHQHLVALPDHKKVFPLLVTGCVIGLIFVVTFFFRAQPHALRNAGVLTAVCVLGVGIYLGLVMPKLSLSLPDTSGQHFGHDTSPMDGTPYKLDHAPLTAPGNKLPCTPQPWGTVSAVNLNTGKAVFQTPLGTMVQGKHTGTVNLGGDVVTAGGLVFAGASEEAYLRAFDATTGEEVWKGALPVPAQSTPMSYTAGGRQYVVIAAGGHGMFGTPISDALVAYALPAAGRP